MCCRIDRPFTRLLQLSAIARRCLIDKCTLQENYSAVNTVKCIVNNALFFKYMHFISSYES